MIRQNSPVLDGNEQKYINNCFSLNQISSSGNFVEKFEKYFSSFCGAKYGIACSSGTSALHLALNVLGIKNGDEVIIPCFSFIADSNMVILSGGKPVFVDVDNKTYCINCELIEEKISSKTKAIIAVHMYGHPCNMDLINKIAKKHNLFVIEDASQAHGTEYKGKRVGTLGDISCFSFYSTKTITSAEGGIILTNKKAVADKLRKMRNQGFSNNKFNYIHHSFGFNYRMSNIQAAIGLAQCEKINEKIELKRTHADIYKNILSKSKNIIIPLEAPWAKSTFWNYFVIINSVNISRDLLMKKLLSIGIETKAAFQPLNTQPIYKKKQNPLFPDTFGNYPISKFLAKNGLSLPSSIGLTKNQIIKICIEILEVV